MAKKNKFLREPEIIASVNWAILSHLKPHHLAYRINEVCHWNLERLKNLNSGSKSKSVGFALFNYQADEMHPDFYLIALKEVKNFLVKDLKQFDYLLQVRVSDEDTHWDSKSVMKQIKSVENVLGVFEINIDTIKNTNILFFDKQLDSLGMESDPGKKLKIKGIVK